MPQQCVPLRVATCAGSLPEADCSAIIAGHQAAARIQVLKGKLCGGGSLQRHSAPLLSLTRLRQPFTGLYVLCLALTPCLGRDGSFAASSRLQPLI